MNLSTMRPAAFLHIQKTAGTSVQVMARHAYGNDGVISHDDYKRYGIDGCRKIPFVSGHFGFAFAKALGSERYTFTFLRNPVDRLISLYRFCRSRSPSESEFYRIAHSVDFHQFLEPIHGDAHWRTVWNNQVFQIYRGMGAELAGEKEVRAWDVPERDLLNTAKENLAKLDYVGFQETFSRDVVRVFAALGAGRVKVRRYNTSDPRSAITNLPMETRRRIQDITRLDWLLYEHAIAEQGADFRIRVARARSRVRQFSPFGAFRRM